MNQLHEKILQQCRDEVSKTPKENRWGTVGDMLSDEQDAALLAMERLGEFRDWLCDQLLQLDGTIWKTGNTYMKYESISVRAVKVTEEELYQEFEKQRT